MKILVESVHFDADQKLVQFVEEKVGKLETFFDKIIESDVTLKMENSGQIKDKIAEIRIHVPGDTLFARDSDKTFEGAVDQCVASVKRQLIKYKEMQRSHT